MRFSRFQGGNVKEDFRGARTYRLKESTIKQINQAAVRYECWQSDLVDLLLQRALTELEQGRWQLEKSR